MPKFDYIIQNPPYSANLHIQIENHILDNALSDDGKMVIIQPASWLIDVRKPNGRNKNAPIFDELKNKLGKHVYKVVIENYNKEFDISNDVPFSITYIDLKHEYENIEFHCFGECRNVSSLYDCNLIGDYEMILSILGKIQKYGEKVGTFKQHICDIKHPEKYKGENYYFLRFSYGQLNTIGTPYKGNACVSPINSKSKNYLFFNNTQNSYLDSYYHVFCMHDIKDEIPTGIKRKDKFVDCLYGTKQELENWKYFVFNNKIPLFTSIVLVISQNNRVKDFIPWLTDKQYTDEEIYKLLNINEEEQLFIDRTIKKYERHSPWFKRYMCGPDSVSDEEVQKFINIL